jgi:hypothetical protein
MAFCHGSSGLREGGYGGFAGFGRGGNFGVNRFGFNGLRLRRGEGPVPAKLAELIEDGLALGSELPFAGGEERSGLDIDFDIQDAGLGGHDAGEAPIDGGEVEDEVQFGLVGGLEAANEGLEEVVERVLVLAAEDARELGVTAVLEGVHGGTGFALGRLGAAGACAIAPGGFELLVSESDERHNVGSVWIVAGGAMKPRDAAGLFH